MQRRNLLLGLAPALCIRSAAAQPWPQRQVRIVVGFAPGGSNDVMARLLAARLGERMGGVSFVVENRAGAGTLLAADHVARAAPDGYTLMYTSTSTVTAPLLSRSATLDPTRDFAAIAMAQVAPLVLLSRPEHPARTLADVIAMARAQPGRVTMSHPGNGGINHLALGVFTRQLGIEFNLIPYAGNAPSLTALMRGEVDLASDSPATSRPLVEAGTLRAIALTSAERFPLMPDVPTFAETVPGYDVTFWGGMLAPRATPAAILDRLHDEIRAVLLLPDVVERVRGFGSMPGVGSRADFAQAIAQDWARWNDVVDRLGLRAG